MISKFIDLYKDSLAKKTFVKLSINHSKKKDFDIKKISFLLVTVQNETQIKCTYTHQTKDITKIYSLEESSSFIKEHLGVNFKNGILFTTEKDIHILFNKKMEGRIMTKKSTFNTKPSTEHNKKKKRFINIHKAYLQGLKITDNKGNINKNMLDKFKQINKYIETVDGILKSSKLKNKKQINIVDMGSGKGYLTFALYDYITNILQKETKIIGVEQRLDLVQLCNKIAQENEFVNLSFSQGTIDNFETEKIDILIALHACDTATDDAIFKGIQSKASIIITAPCCHKQVRKQLHIDNELKEITQFGILEERQAEILTDTIRALVLESEGYNSQVFEFIADAHTHKNVMIVGTKKKTNTDAEKYLKKIDVLKAKFGVEYQHLEKKIREKS
jgi:tRNA A58 N-methylase Trm61